MIVGGYTLDLYCEVQGCKTHHGFGEATDGLARKAARAAGWTVKVTANECYCPAHKRSSGERI